MHLIVVLILVAYYNKLIARAICRKLGLPNKNSECIRHIYPVRPQNAWILSKNLPSPKNIFTHI